MQIRIQRIHPDALLPKYAHGPEEDAGMDLCTVESVTLQPGEARLVPTGLTIELPPGYEAQVRPRSGLALRQGITCLNTPGTIDSDYRGELNVILINLSAEPQTLHSGDRIAQLVVQKTERAAWQPVAALSETARNAGGFGSTGKT